MKFYNTFSKKYENFKPINKKSVGVYSCGPTVYGRAHIGNLRAYIFSDVLVRSLKYFGYKVNHAMNITDVGHLVSDADEGEDKMDIASKREHKNPLEIAKTYEKLFFEDIKSINIINPSKIRRATATIKEQQSLIKILEKRGYTYKTKNAVYFDISKFKQYGKLSGQKLNQKKNISREGLVDDPTKKHPQDFALWIFTTGKHSKHILRWKSPWGEGFPGWHIECSAISRKLLGQPFDIHTGGVDHIGVHHENEIAQSLAAFNTPLANIWMHNDHLIVDGRRMGKSIGNVYNISEIKSRKIDPIAFRYFCLQAHYRSILNFTFEGINSSQNALKELIKFIRTVRIGDKEKLTSKKLIDSYIKKFNEAISDDLNTPNALAVVWTLIKDTNIPLLERQKAILNFDKILGLGLSAYKNKRLPAKILNLIRKREALRSNKQFIQSDVLRKKIEELGYTVDDRKDGVYISNNN